MIKLNKLLTIICLSSCSSLVLAVTCPPQLNNEQLKKIKERNFSIYNTKYEPLDDSDFSLPYLNITATNKQIQTIKDNELSICTYTYTSLLGEYKLRIKAFKPANIWVNSINNLNEGVNEAIKKIESLKIKSKNRLLNDVLIVFDWDETISAKDGEDELRDEDTKELLKSLAEKGIDIMVLTARGTDVPFEKSHQGELRKWEDKMTKTAFGEDDWFRKSKALRDKELLHPSQNKWTYFYNNIFFAPRQNKGKILTSIIDDKYLNNKKNYLVFIDNELRHINAVADEFNGRNENIFILHYPLPTGN